ncbi:hypothetical protein [Salinibacterium sp. ZJ454]|uniref:hypothetical protein n=1 Tax=Salinibacterium sp. ZJ454 TaxID=2708339 RepID=UPI001AB035DE|nr:hypothetical protein [Salinibacterium sp. ZJ454]
MHAVRRTKRRTCLFAPPALAAAILLTTACTAVPTVGGAEDAAIEQAKAQFVEARDAFTEGIRSLPPEGFVAFAESGGFQAGGSFIGLSDDELRQQRLGGTWTYQLSAAEEDGEGRLLTLITADAETGGGLFYDHANVYACIDFVFDLASKTLVDVEDTECPQPILDIAPGDTLVSVDQFE